MNGLFHIRKDWELSQSFSLADLLYVSILSNLTRKDVGGTIYAVFDADYSVLYDYFSEWSYDEIRSTLIKMAKSGKIMFRDQYPDTLFVGTYVGRRICLLSGGSSQNLYDKAKSYILKKIEHSPIPKARKLYIIDRINEITENGADKVTPGDLTKLHGYLYEIYTGGEQYIIRNKTENFQTNNILKAYSKGNAFAIVTFATLDFDEYRDKGVPTLINVGMMKDDVFGSLTKKDTSSKDYMREKQQFDEGGF